MSGHGLLHGVAVAAAAVAGRADRADARHQEGAADRHAGSRGAQALGGDLDVAVLAALRGAPGRVSTGSWKVSHQAASGSISEAVLAANVAGTSSEGFSTGVEQPVKTRAIDAASAAATTRPVRRSAVGRSSARHGGSAERRLEVAAWDGSRVDSRWCQRRAPVRAQVVSVGSRFGRHFGALIFDSCGVIRRRRLPRARRPPTRGRHAIDASSSSADANSCWRPVTRFSRRPARAPGVASPRRFTTYARRYGYLDSGFRTIADQGLRRLGHSVGGPLGGVVSERSDFGRDSVAERATESRPVADD